MKAYFDKHSGILKIDSAVVQKGISIEEICSCLLIENCSEKNGVSEETSLLLKNVDLCGRRFNVILLCKEKLLNDIHLYWLDGFYMQCESWEKMSWDQLEKEHFDSIEWLTKKLESLPTKQTETNAVWEYQWGFLSQFLDDRSMATRTIVHWK